MRTFKQWGLQAGTALAFCCATGLTSAADLVIGQVAPLSGVLATTGAQMVVGGKIYFDHVNEQGGIHGAMIKQVVVDDAYKVDETSRLTREMLARPEVVALFGFAGTANVSKLLEDGILDVGGAAPCVRLRRHTLHAHEKSTG